MPNYKEIKLYNGEIVVLFNEEKHQYWIKEPKMRRLAGVTTICGILNKPFLIPWAVNTTIDYVKKNIDVLQSGTVSGNDILEMARNESDRIKTDSADLGKAIHKWVEDYIMGRQPEMPEDERIMIGVSSFLDWEKENKIKYLWSEKVVYSKKHGFVGTADIGVQSGKKKYLVDLKTGNSLYPEVKLQTSAYAKASEEENGIKFDGRWALRLSKETEEEYYERMGKKNLKSIPPYKVFDAVFLDEDPEEMERDYNSFINALNLYEWQKSADKIFRALK
jgi:hypothetical protein